MKLPIQDVQYILNHTDSRSLKYKSDLIDYIVEHDWKNPCAVTLTLKSALLLPDGTYRYPSLVDYSRALRHFLNRLNKRCFGNRARVEFIAVFVVIEKTENGRSHYHLVTDRPDGIAAHEFFNFIVAAWESVHWGYEQVDVQEVYDLVGWLDYILKFDTKDVTFAHATDWQNRVRDRDWNLSDAIDWENCRLKRKKD